MQWLTQVFGLFKREIARFLKVPFQTVGSPIITSTLYLAIFGISIGAFVKSPLHVSYLEFLIPGLVMMNIVRGSYENTTSSIIGSKYVNELQDLRTAPLSRLQIVKGIMGAAIIRGLITAFLTFLVGTIFCLIYNGYFMKIHHPFYMLFFLLFGAASFSSLGMVIAMFSRSFEQVSIFGSFILTPLIYLGGVFFSLDMLSPIWQNIARINPIFYLIQGLRLSVLTPASIHVFYEALFLFLFFVICVLISLIALKKGRRYVR
ncbi:MAG: ABC transporter permease [Simkaniaceae bacterium]|nr:ABC transporter permease [Simkaniaceae bacterium]MCF7851742.1 ABC transporter permease [Simkaniaceae bacterium]